MKTLDTSKRTAPLSAREKKLCKLLGWLSERSHSAVELAQRFGGEAAGKPHYVGAMVQALRDYGYSIEIEFSRGLQLYRLAASATVAPVAQES